MRSAADWGLYDGWNLKGWPVATIVRGEEVMRDGQIVGSPSHGTYVPRYPA
jgi:dihydropyrimidinase